jgi:hypothetical protein
MSLLALSGTNSVSGGYEIDNSVKLEADNTEFFSRTPSSNTNRQTFTYSTWVKRTELGINGAILDAYQDGANMFLLQFDTSDRFVAYNIDSGTDYGYHYTRKFRDTSAWYHIVFVSDTTNGTASDRYQLYVNGERISNSDIDVDYGTPPQDYNNNLNSTITHNIGKRGDGPAYNSCYLAETHLVDGTALAPTAFGEFDEDSGIWKPKAYTGSYGTNGFFLDFADASDLGDDESGNGNDFTENNITAADQATDTPTNNFCTLNPLHNYYNEVSRFTVSEGGTSVTGNQSGTLWRGVPSTFAVSKGKWYFEMETTNQYLLIGTGSADTGQTEWAELTSINNPSTKAKMMYGYNGNIYGYNSSTDAWQYGFHFGYGDTDIISVAVDLDNGHMYFRKNGAAWTDSGDPTSGSTGTGAIDLPWYDTESTVFIVTVPNNVNTALLNFGGYTTGTISSAASDANGYGTFEYAPPSGYYALCTKNLALYGGTA